MTYPEIVPFEAAREAVVVPVGVVREVKVGSYFHSFVKREEARASPSFHSNSFIEPFYSM